MIFKIASSKTPVLPPAEVAQSAPPRDENAEADHRRQMYERIAMGNALAEAEEHARRKWRGR